MLRLANAEQKFRTKIILPQEIMETTRREDETKLWISKFQFVFELLLLLGYLKLHKFPKPPPHAQWTGRFRPICRTPQQTGFGNIRKLIKTVRYRFRG